MNPYVIGGVGFIIIVLSWQLKASITRNGELTEKLKTQVSETVEAVEANDTNLSVISDLNTKIATMVNERKADAVLREKVLDERDKELATVRAQAQKLRNEREEAFDENPDCKDFAELSVEFFCPTIGSQLRERSASIGSNQN